MKNVFQSFYTFLRYAASKCFTLVFLSVLENALLISCVVLLKSTNMRSGLSGSGSSLVTLLLKGFSPPPMKFSKNSLHIASPSLVHLFWVHLFWLPSTPWAHRLIFFFDFSSLSSFCFRWSITACHGWYILARRYISMWRHNRFDFHRFTDCFMFLGRHLLSRLFDFHIRVLRSGAVLFQILPRLASMTKGPTTPHHYIQSSSVS